MIPLLPPQNEDKDSKTNVSSSNPVERIPLIVHCFVMMIGVAWQLMILMAWLGPLWRLRLFLAFVLDSVIVWLIIRSKGSLTVTMICWILLFSSPVWLEWIVRLY